MDNRPYKTVREFRNDKVFVAKVLDLLEKRYDFFMEQTGHSIFDSSELERNVYKIVKIQLGEITIDQGHTAESIFDSFSGAMFMLGDSAIVFEMLKSQFGLDGDSENKPDWEFENTKMKHAQIYIHIEEDLGEGNKFLRTLHNFEFIFRKDQEVYDAATEWIEENCTNEQKLKLHLEVIEIE